MPIGGPSYDAEEMFLGFYMPGFFRKLSLFDVFHVPKGLYVIPCHRGTCLGFSVNVINILTASKGNVK